MNGSQGHEGHQQNRQSDDQEADVSIAASYDEANSPGGQHETELKGDTGICRWEEHVDHP